MQSTRRMHIIGLVATLALLLAACGGGEQRPAGDGSENAQTEDLFAGKTITLLSSFGAGSSPDILSRIIANHLGKHLPGNPSVEVRPAEGGGGAVAMQRLAGSGDDGTTLVSGTSGILTRWLFGEDGHDYPLEDMQIVSAFPASNIEVIRTELGRTAQDLIDRNEPLRGGNTSVGSTLAINQLISARLLGIEIEQLFGYSGPADFAPALERGEIDSAHMSEATFVTVLESVIGEGIATALYQDGQLNESGEIVRSPIIPDIPTVVEVYEEIHGEEPPPGPEWDDYVAMQAVGTIADPLLASQDTRPEYLAALREGMVALSKDEDFMDDLTTTLGSEVEMTSPEASAAALNAFVSLDPNTVERLEELSGEG